MTKKEEYTQKLQELEASANAKVVEYNKAHSEKRVDDADKLAEELDKIVDEHAGIAKKLCFEECKEQEDPMLAAINKLSYRTIVARDFAEGEDGSKTITRKVVERDRQIDLIQLDNYCGGIGRDPNWKYMIEQLNLLLALDCAVSIGKGKEFCDQMRGCYAISEAAKNLDFGIKGPTPGTPDKAGTPISSTALLKAVKAVVTAMIGEEYGNKTLTHDVRFLKIASARKSRKALTIQCANHKFMRGYIAEVCHRIVNNKVYDVDYKKIK